MEAKGKYEPEDYRLKEGDTMDTHRKNDVIQFLVNEYILNSGNCVGNTNPHKCEECIISRYIPADAPDEYTYDGAGSGVDCYGYLSDVLKTA